MQYESSLEKMFTQDEFSATSPADHQNELMTTAESIMDLRQRVGHDNGNQTEFATLLGVSVQYLNDVLLGKRRPSEVLGYERVVMWRRLNTETVDNQVKAARERASQVKAARERDSQVKAALKRAKEERAIQVNAAREAARERASQVKAARKRAKEDAFIATWVAEHGIESQRQEVLDAMAAHIFAALDGLTEAEYPAPDCRDTDLCCYCELSHSTEPLESLTADQYDRFEFLQNVAGEAATLEPLNLKSIHSCQHSGCNAALSPAVKVSLQAGPFTFTRLYALYEDIPF
jgi:hypothetical protein